MQKKLKIAAFILGIISGIVIFIAGSSLKSTGSDMNELRSQSGTSLAEVYYQEVGQVTKGAGFALQGIAVGVIAISIKEGSKVIAK